jgi:DNA-binding GntR family transcriptional regulator
MSALFAKVFAEVNADFLRGDFRSMRKPAKLTRADDVYLVLKDDIRMNRMPPGYQAPEPELAVRLGVSRTTIREALIRLEAEGLVELIPRRGARILPLRADDMKEIYEILTSLEPDAAARLAARNPTSEELAPMEKAADDMEAALTHGDLEAWAEADDRFHLALLDLHGNRRMNGFIAALNDQVHRARMVTLRLREAPVKSNEEHREILQGLKNADPEAARQAFLTHRQRAAKELVGILVKSGIGQL